MSVKKYRRMADLSPLEWDVYFGYQGPFTRKEERELGWDAATVAERTAPRNRGTVLGRVVLPRPRTRR